MPAVCKNGRWGVFGFLPEQYEEIKDVVYDNRSYHDSYGAFAPCKLFCIAKSDGKYGVVLCRWSSSRKNDGAVIPFEYEGICSLIPNNFGSEMWFAAVKKGRMGALSGDNGKVMIPFKYDNLGPFNFDPEIAGIMGIPSNLCMVTNGGKYGVVTFAKEERSQTIVPINCKPEEIYNQVLSYNTNKNNSFLIHSENYLENNSWENKGEFETTAEYEARLKDTLSRPEFEKQLKKRAENIFLQWMLTDKDRPFLPRLGNYNADTESFNLQFSNSLGKPSGTNLSYSLTVPRNEAPEFKKCFNTLKPTGIAYFVENDRLGIGTITYTTPTAKLTHTAILLTKRLKINYLLFS